jgi:hypothetical protein
MTHPSMSVQAIDATRQTVNRLGFWAASLTALVTLVAFALALTALPISGSNCRSECVTYPYTDSNVVAHVPHDYYWMYPATLLAPCFVVLLVCIHYYAAPEKKIFSHLGLAFALIYASVMSMNYFIQLTVLQPSLLKNEIDNLALFSQYNSHGIFIALEGLGYLMMSLAFFCLTPIFTGQTRPERVLRWSFSVNAPLGIAALVILTLIYGQDLEDRFEVIIILINWVTLTVAGVCLSILFRRAGKR